ncbi:hypothetical protein F2Q68_00025130 [Brassica cretica]|nr:hypothetical protein F2Q68_00025130 [Brassica cretica]
MFEEADTKWVRAADREHKSYNNKNHRSGHRGEEESPRGERAARSEARTEGNEEGEIKEMERSNHKEEKVQDQAQPSQAFLAELMETQGELPKVISNPSGGEQELDLEHMGLGLVEGNNLVSDVGMGLEEHHIGGCDGGSRGKEAYGGYGREDRVTGEMEKRQGTRKKAVKPSLGAAASNTLKMAQLMAAKRTVAKPGIRHGDHSKGA